MKGKNYYCKALWLLVTTVIALSGLVVAILVDDFHHTSFSNTITTQAIIAGDIFFEITEPYSLEYTYRLRPAKDFGGAFSQRLEGVALVLTNPSDACTEILNSNMIRGNVAFIDRGECSFVTKAINAELAGASAAIITEFKNDSREFDYYIEMVHDKTERDIEIPAGFLLGRNGIVIKNTLLRERRAYAIINLPVNLTFTPPSKINHPPWLDW